MRLVLDILRIYAARSSSNTTCRPTRFSGLPIVVAMAFTDDVVMKVKALLDEGSASGSRVAAWEQIQDALLKAGLGWTAQMPPDFVGVHPCNRSRLGVGGSEAHFHGAQILQAGFSWAKAADATAVEAPPYPHDMEAAAANDKFVSLSDGLIPPLSQMKLMSIGGGHTNTFLRAVKAGCRSAVPSLADQSGRLSAEALCVNRPAFRDAVSQGLKWFVIHWRAPEVWPSLVHFVQAALNTIPRNEQSEVEVMLDLHRQWKACVLAGEEAEWSKIEEAACWSMPPCAQYIRSLVAFVKANAGGVDGTLLEELSSFFKTFACSESGATRRLGSEFMTKLAALSFGPGERYPYVMNACIEANLSSPKVVDGLCRLLQPPQLQALASKENRAMVKAAEKLMCDARELCTRLGVPKAASTKFVGKCDVRCILVIVKKVKEVEKKDMQTIEHVAEALVSDLAAAGYKVDVSSVISSTQPPSKAQLAAPADVPETIDQLKSLTFQAGKLGFVSGAAVVLKHGDGAVCMIKSLSDGSGVEFEGDAFANLPVEELLAKYKVHKGKLEEQLPGYAGEHTAHMSVAWGLDIVRGIVGLAVRAEFAKHTQCLASIELLVNPSAVKAVTAVPKGDLVIVAASSRIDVKRPSSSSVGWVSLGEYELVEGSQTKLYMSHHFVPPIGKNGEPNKLPFVSPFWHVRNVAQAKQATMELAWRSVSVAGVCCQVPFLTNKRELKVGDELTWHHVDSAEPGGTASASAKKRARR